MAKKFVRGITDVKTITKQDYDTNNVNDLLSDGQYNYIHRKKGKNEEYHNLTDNIKTISSDNTELLSVTNNNKTTAPLLTLSTTLWSIVCTRHTPQNTLLPKRRLLRSTRKTVYSPYHTQTRKGTRLDVSFMTKVSNARNYRTVI